MKRRVSWVLIGFIVVMVMAASGYEYQNLGVTGYIHGTTFPFHVLPSSITTGSVSSPGYPANTNISISTDTPLTAKLTIGNRTDQFPIGLNATRRYITLTNQIIQYTFSNPSNNRTAEGGMEVSSNGLAFRRPQAMYAFSFILTPLTLGLFLSYERNRYLRKVHRLILYSVMAFIALYGLVLLSVVARYLEGADFIPAWDFFLFPFSLIEMVGGFDLGVGILTLLSFAAIGSILGYGIARLGKIIVGQYTWAHKSVSKLLKPTTAAEKVWYYLCFASLYAAFLSNLIFYPPATILSGTPLGPIGNLFPSFNPLPTPENSASISSGVIAFSVAFSLTAALTQRIVILRFRPSSRSTERFAKGFVITSLFLLLLLFLGVLEDYKSKYIGLSYIATGSIYLVASAIPMGLLDYLVSSVSKSQESVGPEEQVVAQH